LLNSFITQKRNSESTFLASAPSAPARILFSPGGESLENTAVLKSARNARGTPAKAEPVWIYEGEEITLEGIETLRAEGLGFDRIAARLNAENVPTGPGRSGMGLW
jgi:hypothetical protein